MITLESLEKGYLEELAQLEREVRAAEAAYHARRATVEEFGGLIHRNEIARRLGVSEARVSQILDRFRYRDGYYSLGDVDEYRATRNRKGGRPRVKTL